MSNNGVEQIVIRHVSGSKANQIEHISLAGVNEITIGRDPKSNIAFDASRDDIVSRRHAAIRVVRGDRILFRLADLGSMHGTFLNGERIKDEVELLPEDSIGLGKTGVKFIFDVQPRAAYMVARTRVIDISDAAATRVIETAGIAARDAVPANDVGIEPPPKAGIGKNTVLNLLATERSETTKKLGDERRAASRLWRNSVAGLVAFVILGGGAFYWKHIRDQNAQRAELQRAKEEMAERETGLESKVQEQQADLEKKTAEDRGLSAQEIVERFGNATAQINRAWRLYDQTTGKPIFHQTFSLPDVDKKKKTYPAYVHLQGDSIVRWLTLEDDNRSNIPIGGKGQGTGFAVSEQGFMLTNKHVAAAWNLAFGQADPANWGEHRGWLFEFGAGPHAKDRKLRAPIEIDLDNDKYSYLKKWAPVNGGIVFMRDQAVPIGEEGNIPDPSKSEPRTFFGRNDVLEVNFANSLGTANASLVRFSNDNDAALIKVDTPQQLKKLDIASDDAVTVGEQVIVLGFPSVAATTVATNTTIENGQVRTNTIKVPQPFVTVGNVSVISPAVKTNENGVTVGGAQGDLIQMSINATSAGNSGGPVFNKAGKVIGLFAYTKEEGGAKTSEAVPIKYGRVLMLSQRP